MFEPLTLTLVELAARWSLTPRQVLQHAQQPGVPLYFAYEGLVFDIGDQWHRHGGDWREAQSYDTLIKGVQNNEAWLERRQRGQLTEWDQLTEEEAVTLRREIASSKVEIRKLEDVLERRGVERNRCHFRGFLRAAPSTLWDIESLGSAPFPHKAFHPSSPVKVVQLARASAGNNGWVWDGHLVCLEPMHENDRYWKSQLTADHLVANTDEVKAIEAVMKARGEAVKPPTSSMSRSVEAGAGTVGDREDTRSDGPSVALASTRARQKPAGGDALTPLIWEICYDLSDLGGRVSPGPVMRELKIRAQSLEPRAKGPLMGTSAGGVKFETIDGEEKELTGPTLASRINEWKKAQS